eukprot:2473409-Prymnesium_polylepis.1
MATWTAENHSSSMPPRKLWARRVLPSSTGAFGSMRCQLCRLNEAYVMMGRRCLSTHTHTHRRIRNSGQWQETRGSNPELDSEHRPQIDPSMATDPASNGTRPRGLNPSGATGASAPRPRPTARPADGGAS